MRVLQKGLFLLVCATSWIAHAQLPPPSNIYLGQVERTEGGIKVTGLKAVTQNPEYTNQPYFFDEGILYYTQEIKQGEQSQTDVFRYSITNGSTENVTDSTDSEYSPTPMMDGSGFSVIKVNSDNKQELWKIGFDGEAKTHLVPAIEPVGYHAWTREDMLLLFVLGEPQKLIYANPQMPEEAGVEVATSIGASIYEMPLTLGHTYTVENEEGEVSLFWFDPASISNTRIGYLPKNAQYYAWSSRAELFSTDNGKLVTMPFIVNGREIIHTTFSDVQIDSQSCQGNVSRIALSPYDDQIALVCSK